MSNRKSRVPPRRAGEGWLTRGEVAARLGVSIFKVRDMQKSGELPCIREGDVYLFDAKIVEAIKSLPTAEPTPSGVLAAPAGSEVTDTEAACFKKFENGYLVTETARVLSLPPGQVLAAFDKWNATCAHGGQLSTRSSTRDGAAGPAEPANSTHSAPP
jgi:hypothetical protein